MRVCLRQGNVQLSVTPGVRYNRWGGQGYKLSSSWKKTDVEVLIKHRDIMSHIEGAIESLWWNDYKYRNNFG